MALDRENMDDAGMMQERIVKASKPAFLDIKPSREHMRPVVIEAVSADGVCT